jgi:hypothetical protein
MMPAKGNGAIEAVISLRVVPTSISDMYYMDVILVCCIKSIWGERYDIKQDNLAPDFGIWGHLWRAISNSN